MKRAALPILMMLAGCRGQVSTRPPVHLIGDMVNQPKLRPESASPFFADGRAMRSPVEGTVSTTALDPDDPLASGRGADAKYLAQSPLAADEQLALRGQQRFDIYCAACHDRVASGHGMVVQRGFPPPTDLASDRIRAFTDGEIFDVITHGRRNMPAYAAQVPVRDRWAIVLWLRVLQRSQHATIADVPPELRDRIESETLP